jgi:hypothetical protein
MIPEQVYRCRHSATAGACSDEKHRVCSTEQGTVFNLSALKGPLRIDIA